MTGYKSKLAAAQDKLAQPALEPVAWMYPDALCDRACLYVCTKAFTQFPECATAPPQPAQEPVDWEQIYWDMVNAMLRDKLRAQSAQEPVGEVTENTDNGFKCEFNQRLTAGTKLYTIPPQRSWVGLTEKEKKEIYRLSVYVEGAISLTEAKLKEKNNG